MLAKGGEVDSIVGLFCSTTGVVMVSAVTGSLLMKLRNESLLDVDGGVDRLLSDMEGSLRLRVLVESFRLLTSPLGLASLSVGSGRVIVCIVEIDGCTDRLSAGLMTIGDTPLLFRRILRNIRPSRSVGTRRGIDFFNGFFVETAWAFFGALTRFPVSFKPFELCLMMGLILKSELDVSVVVEGVSKSDWNLIERRNRLFCPSLSLDIALFIKLSAKGTLAPSLPSAVLSGLLAQTAWE